MASRSAPCRPPPAPGGAPSPEARAATRTCGSGPGQPTLRPPPRHRLHHHPRRRTPPLHRAHPAGQLPSTRRVQEDFYALYERTRICRAYLSNVPPGFIQTPAFATALMNPITAFQGTPDDVAEAVAARVARSRFLCEGGRRFVVLMEESVLRYRTADPEAMKGQLRHLLAVMPLASVSLGIIPFAAQRTVWPLEAFYLHDDVQAVVETLTAEINVTQPRELADYAKAFAGLAEMAVYGDVARALIRAAIDALE
ncbi:DUF5753 domain-containing protein [Streptomyces sp. NPDC059161]|uniref:DUF5753 domain-containing protein n=1 Tax=Streptomyces sp. NPDC059161 TaxID=3346749 RepID=UPI0036A9BB57